VLFCRDLTAERDGSLYYAKLPPPPSVDQILKAMSIYELHGLNDIAVDTAVRFSRELGRRVDVERAIDLLSRATGHVRLRDPAAALQAAGAVGTERSQNQTGLAKSDFIKLERELAGLEQQIAAIHNSTSWRITAPLRNLVDRFRQARR